MPSIRPTPTAPVPAVLLDHARVPAATQHGARPAAEWPSHLLPPLTPGAADVLKWLAVLAMVVDHAGLIWFHRDQAWMTIVGRLAFPLFGLLAGYHGARSTTPATRRIVRLLVAAALIEPIYRVAMPAGTAWSIFWTLALGQGIAALALRARDLRGRWTTPLLVGVGLSMLVAISRLPLDYGVPGVVLIVAAALQAAAPSRMTVLAVCWALITLNGTSPVYAAVALSALCVWFVLSRRAPSVSRAPRWTFYLVYPLHLLLLRAACAFIAR